ncbi:DUF930 domain-containing protein [Ensifer aridi]|uniref:DUF930 domain-containing protein n=1 Tax=Ensifer aridi TaxID=1708715 RepID=UPI001FCCF62D|nr:DUF930 domain-containing protein [Ensifer aridi]
MSKAAHPQYGKTIRWGLLAALTLHVIVGISLLRLPILRPLATPREDAIPVELLFPERQNAMNPSAAPKERDGSVNPQTTQPDTEGAEREPEPLRPAPAETGAPIRATELFSAKTLADPRSKGAREALRQLAAGERIIQLCNIEAMEQVHRWNGAFQPDFLVAYAMADPVLSGHVLRVDGGAFRSRRNWYNISFRCEVAPDATTVAAFEFSVGKEIPRNEWEVHALSVDDGATDQP